MSRHHTSEQKAALLADYQSGMSMAMCAEAHGIAESTAHGWINKAGISRGNGDAKRLSAKQKRDAEYGLGAGHWTPNSRGVQIWQPCFFSSAQVCNLVHGRAA